ncbi:TetR/AcrR family transcriptional regulator [Polyangium mundeleinium]|uniref:TetR/AcrR family transcriptional regulator n=1 Tax=Polyangium mundeleinium TaxID=2995306 RepID=A0ABT5EHP3_9BACT|nr:TetR/AcrR family transcriptional regulator [Polyangium mundeleinium]MDC0740442.1 TetR/AcrR family transcriptional regulator [Polyangium mundeleinium]
MVARRSQKPRDPARRQRILEAARRHFTQHGFKGTNLDAVAAEAGCAKGALYLEFADKESLLREVVEQSFAAIGARYAEEVMSIASPLERLVATLRFAYRQLLADPMFGKLLREDPDFRALGLTSDSQKVEEGKAQLAMIRGWVDEGIARGEIRADIDRDAVPIVIGVLRFAPQHLGMIAELGLFSTERALDAIVDVFRAGLAAPKSPPPAKRAGPTPQRRSKR